MLVKKYARAKNEQVNSWGEAFSCTDFIFDSQPNLAMELVVHPSLYHNYYHHIVL